MVEEEILETANDLENSSGGFTLSNNYAQGMMVDGLQSYDGGRISNHRPHKNKNNFHIKNQSSLATPVVRGLK